MRRRTAKLAATFLSVAAVASATVGAISLGGHTALAEQSVATTDMVTNYSTKSVSVNAATKVSTLTGLQVNPVDKSQAWTADINAKFTGDSSITYYLPDMPDGSLLNSDWKKNANAFTVKDSTGKEVATYVITSGHWSDFSNTRAYVYDHATEEYSMAYQRWDNSTSSRYYESPNGVVRYSANDHNFYTDFDGKYVTSSCIAPKINAHASNATEMAKIMDLTGTLYFDYDETGKTLTIKTSTYDIEGNDAKRADAPGNGQIITVATVSADLSAGYSITMSNAPAFGKESDEHYYEHTYSSSVLLTEINGVDVSGTTLASTGGAATDIRYDGEKVIGGKNTIYLREGQGLGSFDVYGPFVASGTLQSISTAVVRTATYTAEDFSTKGVGSYSITLTDGSFSKNYTVVVQKEYAVATDSLFVNVDNAKAETGKKIGNYTGTYISRITDATKARSAAINGVFHGDSSITYFFDGSIASNTEAHGITVYDRAGNAVCTVVNYYAQAWLGNGSRAYVQNELTGVKTHALKDGSMTVMTKHSNQWDGAYVGPIPYSSNKGVNFDGTYFDVETTEGTVYFEYDQATKTLTVKMATLQYTNYTVGAKENINMVALKVDGKTVYTTSAGVWFVYKDDSKEIGYPVSENADGSYSYDSEDELPISGKVEEVKVQEKDADGNFVYKYDKLPNKQYDVVNQARVVTVGIIENADLSDGYTIEFNQPDDFMAGDGMYTQNSKSILVTEINGNLTNTESVKAASDGLYSAEIWGDTYLFDLASSDLPALYYSKNNAWKNVSVTGMKNLGSDWLVYERITDVQVEGEYDLSVAGTYNVTLKGEKDGIPYAQAVKLVVEESTKITLDVNGGVALDDIYISEHSYLRTLPVPERIGWDFVGWYNGTTKLEEITRGMSAVTLQAKWSDDVAPTVNLKNGMEKITVVDSADKFSVNASDVDARDVACGVLGADYISVQVKAPGGEWTALDSFTFDKTKLGTYEVKYTVQDWSGNTAEISRYIEYKPTTPVLTVNGEVPTSGFINENIALPAATAKSGNTDLSVVLSVVFDNKELTVMNNKFKPEQAGTYTVCYAAQDEYNQQVVKTYAITVSADTEKPVINVAFTQTNLVVGDRLELPTATVTDNADTNVQYTVEIRKGNTVVATESTTLNEVGVYTVVYIAEDFAGNRTVRSFEVFVRNAGDRVPNSSTGETNNGNSGNNNNGENNGGNNGGNVGGGCNGCQSSVSIGAFGGLVALMGAALLLKKRKQ